MTQVFAPFDFTALFAGNLQPTSRPVTIASGANAVGAYLPRGSVLGVITASGKYVLSAIAATDGSQKPVAVLAVDVDASVADTVAPAYFVGEFADQACTFGVGHSQATVDAAFAASGQPVFIKVIGTAS